MCVLSLARIFHIQVLRHVPYRRVTRLSIARFSMWHFGWVIFRLWYETIHMTWIRKNVYWYVYIHLKWKYISIKTFRFTFSSQLIPTVFMIPSELLSNFLKNLASLAHKIAKQKALILLIQLTNYWKKFWNFIDGTQSQRPIIYAVRYKKIKTSISLSKSISITNKPPE